MENLNKTLDNSKSTKRKNCTISKKQSFPEKLEKAKKLKKSKEVKPVVYSKLNDSDFDVPCLGELDKSSDELVNISSGTVELSCTVEGKEDAMDCKNELDTGVDEIICKIDVHQTIENKSAEDNYCEKKNLGEVFESEKKESGGSLMAEDSKQKVDNEQEEYLTNNIKNFQSFPGGSNDYEMQKKKDYDQQVSARTPEIIKDITDDILKKSDLENMFLIFYNQLTQNFMNPIYRKLSSLEKKIDDFSQLVKYSKPAAAQMSLVTFHDFTSKHNCEFPMTTTSHFQQFDITLVPGSTIYNDLFRHFNTSVCIEKDLLDTLNIWFQAFFVYENCIEKYTAQKSNNKSEKLLFKSTNFYLCLREALLKAFNKPGEKVKLEEKSLLGILGTIISNYSRDWHGGRKKR